MYTRFFSNSSVSEKGTLKQVAVRFKRKGVRSDVKAAVHDCRELLDFNTHGLVTLAAMKVLDLKDKDEAPSSSAPPQQLLETTAQAVVEQFAVDFRDPESILNPSTAPYQLGKTRFACGYPGCDRTFARDGVVRTKHRTSCKYKVFEGQVILNAPEPNTTTTQPEANADPDSKHNYTCALLREGLLDWARHDAVREGDGDRVFLLWKHDFLYFHVNGHTNYTHLGFTVIAQQLGLVAPAVAHTIRHNRFVNLRGGTGHNVSMDYAMELLNGQVKPALKGRGSTLSTATINRVSRSIKPVEDVQHNVDSQLKFYSGIGRHKVPKEVKDEVGVFVKEYAEENLFDVIPHRSHRSYPYFAKSTLHKLNGCKLRRWIKNKKEELV